MIKEISLISKCNNALFSKDNHIVLLTFDDNYVDQSVNLMESVIHYNKDVSFICLCTALNEKNKELLMSLGYGVCLYEYVADFANSKLNLKAGRWPVTTLFRLFSPWLIDENIAELLYLDCDMICKGDIAELLDMEYKDYVLAMANEIRGNIVQMQYFSERFKTDIYCNAGTLKLNIKEMRERYNPEEILHVLTDNAEIFVFNDQDLLNFYFRDKIHYLNCFLYNFQAYELRKSNIYKAAVDKAKIIHFSIGKPWDYRANFDLINLYQKLSFYEPMIDRCKKARRKRIIMLPVLIIQKILGKVIHK